MAIIKIIKYVFDATIYSMKGGLKYYSWLLFLGFLVFLSLFGWYVQLGNGLVVTGLTDQISDGLYISNFVFLVGVAAAAVTVVFPAYVYHHKQLKEVVVLGEMLAISAVTMCMLFIFAHMGRPDRLWHLIPGFLPPFRGIFNWPNAVLTWDVLVLNGYLFLNFICAFYYLYKKYVGQEVNKTLYMPVVYVAIVWALSIHTVTAFLLGTLPARPMWFHSMMPIKFISTAFAAGPSLIVIAFLIVKKNTKLKIGDEAIDLLSQIVVWCLGIALFLSMSEVVTELYPSTEHSYSLKYLMFGKHGLSGLVLFYWVSLIAMIGAFVMLLIPALRKDHKTLPYICALAFFGIWIEKGMGLVLPGYIPNPVGEFSEYYPTWVEIVITAGNWAFGLMMFTVLVKGSVGILTGEVKYSTGYAEEEEEAPATAAPTAHKMSPSELPYPNKWAYPNGSEKSSKD